jgi:hypothetical protein
MAKSIPQKKNNAKVVKQKTTFDNFENWAERNNQKILYSFLSLSLLFSVLLFNAKFSEANDDSGYVEAAWKYVNEFPNYYFTFNAPLYPMFLAIVYKIFGFNILLFKLLNIPLYLLSVFLFWKSLYKKIHPIVLLPVMFFISINYLMMYFTSMTFTEAFYLFFQSLLFYTVAKFLEFSNQKPIKEQIKFLAVLGLLMLLISISKNIAIVVVPSFVLFYALQKNWKNAGIIIVTYGVFRVLYEVIVKLVWGGVNQFSGQGSMLLLKDPYDRSLGNDDFSGFIGRFFENCNLYLSRRFFQILGFRDENSPEVYGVLAFLVFTAIMIGAYILWKKGSPLIQFVTIYTLGIMCGSFIALQARWDQPRIILVCMPILLIIIFHLYYYFVKNSGMGQLLYIAVIGIICMSTLMSSVKRASGNVKIVKKNLSGDIYEGYTTDWKNFLKCSRWCYDSLPQNSLVASRKAPMSFIYAKGKKFFPVYMVIKKDSLSGQSNPDSALAFLKEKKVSHIMLASLRTNPKQNNGQIITTMHYITEPIMKKYPNALKLVHIEGTSEQAYLFQINY